MNKILKKSRKIHPCMRMANRLYVESLLLAVLTQASRFNSLLLNFEAKSVS
jgi:hypothetical protein